MILLTLDQNETLAAVVERVRSNSLPEGALHGRKFVFLGAGLATTASAVRASQGRTRVVVGTPERARHIDTSVLVPEFDTSTSYEVNQSLRRLERIGAHSMKWLDEFDPDGEAIIVLAPTSVRQANIAGRRTIGGLHRRSDLENFSQSAELFRDLGVGIGQVLAYGDPALTKWTRRDRNGVVLSGDRSGHSAGGQYIRICSTPSELAREAEWLNQHGCKAIVRTPYLRGHSVSLLYFIADDGIAIGKRVNENINVHRRGITHPDFLCVGTTLRPTSRQLELLQERTLKIAGELRNRGEGGAGGVDFMLGEDFAIAHDLGPRMTGSWMELVQRYGEFGLVLLLDALATGDENGPVLDILPIRAAHIQNAFDITADRPAFVKPIRVTDLYVGGMSGRPRDSAVDAVMMPDGTWLTRPENTDRPLWSRRSGLLVAEPTEVVVRARIEPVMLNGHIRGWEVTFDNTDDNLRGHSINELAGGLLEEWTGFEHVASHSLLVQEPGLEQRLERPS